MKPILTLNEAATVVSVLQQVSAAMDDLRDVRIRLEGSRTITVTTFGFNRILVTDDERRPRVTEAFKDAEAMLDKYVLTYAKQR